MQPSAFLFNTARGDIINEAGLGQAPEVGEIAGVVLDLFDGET